MIKLKDLLIEGKMIQFKIKEMDKRKVRKVLDKLRLKMGKDYDKARKFITKAGLKDTKDFAFDALGLKGKMVGLGVVKKHEDIVLELLIKNRINVQGA